MSVGKRILPPYVLVNNQSMAASFTSGATSIENMDRSSIEIICTGTPTGTVSVQASVDFVPSNIALSPQVSPANWFDMPLNLTPLVGAPQNYFIDIGETGIRFIRIKFTRTGGTGNMTVVVSAKES